MSDRIKTVITIIGSKKVVEKLMKEYQIQIRIFPYITIDSVNYDTQCLIFSYKDVQVKANAIHHLKHYLADFAQDEAILITWKCASEYSGHNTEKITYDETGETYFSPAVESTESYLIYFEVWPNERGKFCYEHRYFSAI